MTLMMHQRHERKWRHAALAAALMAGAGLACAADQGAPESPSQAPATPAYKSAFADYRPALEEKETPVQLWRLANDEMGRLKGHAGQLKDAPAAASPDAHSAHHPNASKDKK